MEMVILILHILLALAIIGTVLLQPPESSSLGGLGGSNAMAGPSRGQANLLTRMTAILATAFIITSLTLAILASHRDKGASILDAAESAAPAAEIQKEAPKEAPSVPLSE